MSKKILILTNSGMGLFKFREELIQSLIEKDYKVTLSFPYDEYTERFNLMGCSYKNTKLDRRGLNPLKDFILVLKYLNIIIKENPDTVLTYTIKPNIYGGLVCRILNKTHITNITGLGSSFENDNIIRKIIVLLYKVSLKKSKMIFFQNKSNLEQFKKIVFSSFKYDLLPGSGVNLDKFSQLEYRDTDRINLLYIGRLMKDKGIDELLEVSKFLYKEGSNVSFTIIGENEECYDEKIYDYQQRGYLKYLGVKSDIRKYAEECSAIILPSYHEGLSNVLLEGASMGLPLLASNIPGCKEVIDDGVNGLLFEPKNVNSILKVIDKFQNLSFNERKKMGLNSRLKVENEFNRNVVITKYLNEIN